MTGALTVTVNGQPLGRTYEISSHGGIIVTGSDDVVVGGPSSGATLSGPFGKLEIVPEGTPLTGNKITLDEYNRLLAESKLPNNDWGGMDVAKWKAPEWLGGDPNHLRDYKDAWVRDHATSIMVQSRANDLPPELLAGTAWNEVGGDPVWIDDIAHDVRSFDHMADPYLPTITNDPALTSAGDVSIQVRRAAESMGLDPNNLGYSDRLAIMNTLKNDQANLQIVGDHLRDLADVDFKGQPIGDEEMRVIGARYNRGPHLTLDQIKKNTSYGDLIVKQKEKLKKLLEAATVGQRIVPAGPRPASRG
ncbi:Hypothetical protein A7982_07283 [Minicystis rosea]|nr:Hypothetical protein A7982_07283 [Minicystis rosea]